MAEHSAKSVHSQDFCSICTLDRPNFRHEILINRIGHAAWRLNALIIQIALIAIYSRVSITSSHCRTAKAASTLDPVHPSVHKYLQYLPVPDIAVLAPTRTVAPKYHTTTTRNRTRHTMAILGPARWWSSHSAITMFIHHSYNSQSAKTGNVI